MVLDSPFDRVENVVMRLARRNSSLPEIMIKGGMYFVRKTIEEEAGFDLMSVNPIEIVSKVGVPAMFLIGTNDEVIDLDSFMELYRQYAGPKRLRVIKDRHHHDCLSDDPNILNEAVDFVLQHLGIMRNSIPFFNPYETRSKSAQRQGLGGFGAQSPRVIGTATDPRQSPLTKFIASASQDGQNSSPRGPLQLTKKKTMEFNSSPDRRISSAYSHAHTSPNLGEVMTTNGNDNSIITHQEPLRTNSPLFNVRSNNASVSTTYALGRERIIKKVIPTKPTKPHPSNCVDPFNNDRPRAESFRLSPTKHRTEPHSLAQSRVPNPDSNDILHSKSIISNPLSFQFQIVKTPRENKIYSEKTIRTHDATEDSSEIHQQQSEGMRLLSLRKASETSVANNTQIKDVMEIINAPLKTNGQQFATQPILNFNKTPLQKPLSALRFGEKHQTIDFHLPEPQRKPPIMAFSSMPLAASFNLPAQKQTPPSSFLQQDHTQQNHRTAHQATPAYATRLSSGDIGMSFKRVDGTARTLSNTPAPVQKWIDPLSFTYTGNLNSLGSSNLLANYKGRAPPR